MTNKFQLYTKIALRFESHVNADMESLDMKEENFRTLFNVQLANSYMA